MYVKNEKTTIYLKINKKINNNSIFFLHGFTGSSESWNTIRKQIKTTSLAMDLPGHGKSLFNKLTYKYTYDDFCTDLYLTFNKLNIKKINLCGYSMGGRLALYFTIKYPQLIGFLVWPYIWELGGRGCLAYD